MTGIVKNSAGKQTPHNTSSNARVFSENKNFFPAINNQGMKTKTKGKANKTP